MLDIQFGNVWTNIPKSLFDPLRVAPGSPLHVRIFHDGKIIDEVTAPYERTFGDVPPGKPLVYVNSLLNLAVALNQRQLRRGPQDRLGAGMDHRDRQRLILRAGNGGLVGFLDAHQSGAEHIGTLPRHSQIALVPRGLAGGLAAAADSVAI